MSRCRDVYVRFVFWPFFTEVWNCVLCVATLAGVGVLRLEIALGDFMNVFEAALCGAGFLHVRRTPSEKDCHCLLLPCFCYSKQKVLSRNTRKTAFEIPFFRLDNLMSMRSCLLTRRIKESGMDEIDEMKIGYDGRKGWNILKSDEKSTFWFVKESLTATSSTLIQRLVRSLAELPELSQLVSSVESFDQFVDAPGLRAIGVLFSILFFFFPLFYDSTLHWFWDSGKGVSSARS